MKAIAACPNWDAPMMGPNAMFSILEPHTRIPAHTGTANTRLVAHLPLIVPPGCGFRVGGEQREWQPGQAFVFDDSIEHEAWNDSGEVRAILIVDVWSPLLSAAERDLVRALSARLGKYYGGPKSEPATARNEGALSVA
jgi:aspartate beta-hydroxylase